MDEVWYASIIAMMFGWACGIMMATIFWLWFYATDRDERVVVQEESIHWSSEYVDQKLREHLENEPHIEFEGGRSQIDGYSSNTIQDYKDNADPGL